MDKNLNDILDELGSKEFVNIVAKMSGIDNIFLDNS